MAKTAEQYKEMSRNEFKKAAEEMIAKAKQKNLPNTEFVVGDCENLPFADHSFDVVICTNSFHHYPNSQAFFNSVYRVLRKGGRLILRDYTSFGWVVWLMNHVEMPLANLCGRMERNGDSDRMGTSFFI